MSTNHNRIKVADLEKNQPNKVLVTNSIGELEFSEINYVTSDAYNALDYTLAGKSLDARQGKVLKNLIDDINALLVSDNIDLNTLQNLVDAIEVVQNSLNTLLVNNLTAGGAAKALTAEMGKTLQNNKVDKVAGKSLLADTEITRLGTLSNYTHPANHPPGIITQDPGNRFVTDAEKAAWNAKEGNITAGTSTQYFRGDKTWQTLGKIAVGLANVDNTADAAKNVLSATKLTTPRTINGTAFDGSANITINAIDATARIASSEKGAANGVATLDASGIIPTTQLPSYVDDVLEFINLAGFPATGETGKIYVAKDTNKTYRWGGTAYVYITSGAVDSVSGRTGVITLNKADVGLSTVDNTADSGKNVLSATKLTTPRTINGTAFDGSANITINAVDGTARIPVSEKGTANGVATLDASGIIPTTQLPSYVGDVLEFLNLAGFPVTGETGKIYVAKDTNKTYRWGGTAYVYITSGAVDSVSGRTGVITLTKSDVGLGAVDNTADTTKNVLSATKLTTARTINNVPFDGSANITITDATKENSITAGTSTQYFRGDKTWQTLGKIAVGLANVDNTADAAKNVLSATKLTTPRTINGTAFDGSANITINAVDGTARIPVSEKGTANGVATLDASGIIPTTQLPSYVGDVLEFLNLAGFPATGETGKIYVAKDTNKTYRWGGTAYVYITSGAVDSVSGRTGVITLTKSDVGLGAVDNTADTTKNVLSATKLTTARTINGTAFDGSANIVITDSSKQATGATFFVGTTSIANNRASAGQTLTGVSIDGNAGTATTLQTARTINGVSFNGSANITINAVDSTPRIAAADRGMPNGVAALDASGIILSTQLPSYVDDVLEFTNLAGFPATGDTGKIYVAKDTNKTYRWGGTAYIYITSGAVDSVSGRTGVITLTKSDVGLSAVDNTTDAAKNVLSATKLTTARTINGTAFDGSANITITDSSKQATGATFFVGTTSIANNRASAAQTLTGVSIDGNAGTATTLQTARTINGVSFNGSANITIPINDTSKLPVTGGLMQGDIVFPDTDRSEGIFGTYDSTKTQSIWSMGTAYRNAADGSNFGTLYGLAYKHTNNSTGGNMAGGHQMVWCNNGIQKSSIGDGIWTSGSFIGSGAGLTGTAAALNIGGNAETSNSSRRLSFIDGPRTLSDRLPNSFARTVNFDFVNAGIVGGSGNYGGVMTFAPWDGLSTSTGDSSYQLAFRNESGVNGSGLPGLRLRKGIDTTWGGWYDMIHSGNYNTYSPTLTGIGASGTWGINVTGSVGGSSKFVDLLANRTDVAAYPILWGTNQATNPITGNASTYAFSCDAVKIQSSTGTIIANSFSGNNFISKPNSNSKTLYLGGTPSPSASQASVAVTNGNLHLDPSNGSAIYLGYLSGTGTNFGNGANAVAASISASGVFSGTGVTSSSTISASQYFNTAAAPGNGYGFWAGHPGTYGILMSDAGNSSYGGRISGETSSDYNMYFSMAQGTNRGFVFRNGTTTIASINADGLRTSSDIIAFASSDERLKDNVKRIENPLEKLKAINGYTFDWNDKQSSYVGNDIGVIAQEIEKIMPQIVTTRENGFKAVKYEKIVPLLIEVCKEQQSQIDELKALVNKLIKA